MTRYAIYAVPGADAQAPSDAVALRDAVESWYAARPEITVDPRRYGFHATLKAPFSLRAGRTAEELTAAVTAFAAVRHPIVLPAVRPTVIASFRALVSAGDTTEIDALAADVVTAFEPFRAPLTASDVARRRPQSLSERQRELLGAYGYPFVLDEFRFHMTLTDALPAGTQPDPDDVDAAIVRHFAGVTGRDILLTAIAVVVEPAPGEHFEIHSLHPFQESA